MHQANRVELLLCEKKERRIIHNAQSICQEYMLYIISNTNLRNNNHNNNKKRLDVMCERAQIHRILPQMSNNKIMLKSYTNSYFRIECVYIKTHLHPREKHFSFFVVVLIRFLLLFFFLLACSLQGNGFLCL